MANLPSDLERIRHMLEAIEKVFRYTENLSFQDFFEQEMVQDAVIKNFEIIGEAVFKLSKEFQSKYTQIEWKKIAGLRHILVHDYYKIDPEIIWNTKNNNLEQLHIDLENILKNEA